MLTTRSNTTTIAAEFRRWAQYAAHGATFWFRNGLCKVLGHWKISYRFEYRNEEIYQMISTILSNSFLKLKVNYLFCILQGVQESRTPRGRGDTSPFRDNKDSSKFYHLIHKPVCEHEGRQPGIFLCLGVIMIIHFIKTWDWPITYIKVTKDNNR